MPEGPEIRIMSDFINQNTKDKTFTKLYHVEKGNIPHEQLVNSEFTIQSDFNGKELIFSINEKEKTYNYSVFMGMSGNWKLVDTKDWNSTKYIRLRCDSKCGKSLLLYGSYMGPKFRIGGFTGVKRGPDIVKDFTNFKSNVENNLHKKVFNNPICEVLLDQKYFNGVGNYVRSTIIYYMDINPFLSARLAIQNHTQLLEMCRDVLITSYNLNGGQLQDWQNPFDTDCTKFKEWVFYQKGKSVKDSTGRTFWFNEKWEKFNIYQKCN